MIRHIEFCLDEIEWELRAQGPDGLLFDEKVVLRDHISRMRTVLAKYRDRPEKYAIARLGNDNTENVGVDDLTLIQGVDLAVATRLKEIGVSKFETIADWRVEDVLQFANETLSPERISQQNWIEQAAILATGKLTHHARRVQRGDINCVVHIACKVNEAAALVDEPNEAQAEQKQGAGDVKTDFKISDSPILSVEAMKSHGSPATPHESRSVKAAHNVILFNPAEIHRIRRSRIRIAASLLLVAALTLVACLLNSPALALS